MRAVSSGATGPDGEPVKTRWIPGSMRLHFTPRPPTLGRPTVSSAKRVVPLSKATLRTRTATSQSPVRRSPALRVSARSSPLCGSTRNAPS